MDRVTVGSSSIAAIGYASASRVLEVEYCNGGVYWYLDVPPDEHAALMEAPSKGRHVNMSIKPRYSFERVGAR